MTDVLVHSWYRLAVMDGSVTPFNQRTKTVDEIITHLEAVSIISAAVLQKLFTVIFLTELRREKRFPGVKYNLQKNLLLAMIDVNTETESAWTTPHSTLKSKTFRNYCRISYQTYIEISYSLS